ncbi:MAG TPA: sigma-70 family RNA polymerase sigma factor [Rhizomicrobium sp.]|nr:sigma-70 family RNA polymerase sigma factor [Rhizomicrobium sp.]
MTDAISVLKAHESKLLAYINRRCRNSSLSEDIMQETLLRVIEQSRKNEIEQPLAYAYRVADSVIFAQARKTGRETEIGDADFESDVPLADEVLEHKQRTEIFRKALAELTPLRRTIFVKRYLERKSRREIADEMGIGLESVKKHLVRAIVDLSLATGAKAAESKNKKQDAL